MWFGVYALVAASAFAARAWAGPDGAGTAAKVEAAAEEAAVRVAPNYALEERFLPDQVSKLVFDLAVTPHWFSESDRFWYSYQTTEGTRYYIVDPTKKSKIPLWDNAKVAAALSTLTNFPYDAQHLQIKRLKLMEKDTRMRFEVEIRKNAVVPNEPKKEKSQEDIEEQGKEGEMKQGEQQGQATQATGQPAEKHEDTRTIYFEYDIATGKVTRLDNFEAPKKKPMWAAVSPDGKMVVFARGFNLYQMDGENYAKALKKAGDASVVETQVTTDGVEKYSYARVLLPEQEEQLKKENKGDTNKAGPRTPAVTIHWSKDSKKFALERDDNHKVGDYWVIHSLTNPRPILEARSYPLPGEANVPVSEIDIFDVASKQRAVVQPKSFVDEVLTISDAPQIERDREELREEQEENRLNPTPLSRVGPRWVAETSDKLYFTSRSRDFRRVDVEVADSVTGKAQKLIEESSNVWMSQKPLRLVENGKEMLWWSERDGWGHFYLYDALLHALVPRRAGRGRGETSDAWELHACGELAGFGEVFRGHIFEGGYGAEVRAAGWARNATGRVGDDRRVATDGSGIQVSGDIQSESR